MNKKSLNQIGVIIVTYNSIAHIKKCLDAILRSKLNEKQIVIVDNNSKDNIKRYLTKNFKSVIFVKNRINKGYGSAINQGAKVLQKFKHIKYYMFVNPDTILFENCLINLFSNIKENKFALASPQLLNSDSSLQRSYGKFPGLSQSLFDLFFITSFQQFFDKVLWKLGFKRKIINQGYCDGAINIIKADIFWKFEGFDQDFFFYCEETDFCKRLRDHDFNIVVDQKALAIHDRGGSSTKGKRNQKYYLKLLVNSQFLYLKKHSSHTKTRVFKWFQILHNKKMEYVYLIFHVVFSYFKINKYKIKRTHFKTVSKLYLKYKIGR